MYRKCMRTSRIIILGAEITAYNLAIYCIRFNIDVILINSGNKFSEFEKTISYNICEYNCDNLSKIEKKALFFGVKVVYDNICKIDYIDNCFFLVGNNFKYKTYSLVVDFKNLNINLYKYSNYLNKFDTLLFDSFFYKKKEIAIIGNVTDIIPYIKNLIKHKNIIYLILNNNKYCLYFLKNILKNIYNIKIFINHALCEIKKSQKKYDISIINNKNKQKIQFNVEKYYFINDYIDFNLYNINNYVKLNKNANNYLTEKYGFFVLNENINLYHNDLFSEKQLIKKIIHFFNLSQYK